MGRVNAYVKWSYVVVTSIALVISILSLAATLFFHGVFVSFTEPDAVSPSISVMYIICILNVLIPIIGLVGACKKKTWVLIVFAVGMILSSLCLLAWAVIGASMQPWMHDDMKMTYLEMLPLSNASETDIRHIQQMQELMKCCGIDKGYQDWGYNISRSCLCPEDVYQSCVAAPTDSSLFQQAHDKPVMIYKEPCLPYVVSYHTKSAKISIAVLFGIALIWVSSSALSIVILCQLRKKQETPTVVYSAEAKTGNYTILSETADVI